MTQQTGVWFEVGGIRYDTEQEAREAAIKMVGPNPGDRISVHKYNPGSANWLNPNGRYLLDEYIRLPNGTVAAMMQMDLQEIRRLVEQGIIPEQALRRYRPCRQMADYRRRLDQMTAGQWIDHRGYSVADIIEVVLPRLGIR